MTNILKTTKLSLALFSAALFFFAIVLKDYSYGYGESINFFGLYTSPLSFYFFLGLIIVLILAIINYFSTNEKFNIATNISALFVVVSFIVKLLAGVNWLDGYPHICISLVPLLSMIMIAAIFMLDKKFNIRLKFKK